VERGRDVQRDRPRAQFLGLFDGQIELAEKFISETFA